jgi:hypothetical protein
VWRYGNVYGALRFFGLVVFAFGPFTRARGWRHTGLRFGARRGLRFARAFRRSAFGPAFGSPMSATATFRRCIRRACFSVALLGGDRRRASAGAGFALSLRGGGFVSLRRRQVAGPGSFAM